MSSWETTSGSTDSEKLRERIVPSKRQRSATGQSADQNGDCANHGYAIQRLTRSQNQNFDQNV